MATRFLEHGELPLFFWGQAYGVALFEAVAGAVAFATLGASGGALKLGALAIFAGGWLAFVAAARRLAGDRAALLSGVLLASTPAWLAFSAKAWGGFVTSFALTALTLLVLGAPREHASRLRATAAGGLAALVLFSQAIAAVALLPMLLADEVRPRRRGEWAALAAGALVVGAALLAAANPGEAYWAPSLFRDFGGTKAETTGSPPSIGHVLVVMATGCHFMNTPLPASTFARASAALVLLALSGLVVAAAVRVARTRSFPIEAACAASALAVVAVVLAMRPEAVMFRYLVPLIAPLSLGTGVLLARFVEARGVCRLAAVGGVALWVIAGLGAAFTMRSLPFSGWSLREERALRPLVAMLERDNVRAVCTTHPTLQWSLMFESQGRIPARWTHPKDRRPELPAAVDAAAAAGERVALVAMPPQARAVETRLRQIGGSLPERRVVGDAFVVYVGVSAAQLRAIGFQPAPLTGGARPARP